MSRVPFDGPQVVTTPEVFSLDGLITWLETQDPATEYNHANPLDCVNCRYFTAMGVPWRAVGPWEWLDREGRRRPLPYGLNEAAKGVDGVGLRQTYGSALARARALRATGDGQ